MPGSPGASMPEWLRSASATLRRVGTDLATAARSAGAALVERVGPAFAGMRDAVREQWERTPERALGARTSCAGLLRRLADRLAPPDVTPVAEAPAPEVPAPQAQAEPMHEDFASMLSDLGAEPVAHDGSADPLLKETTIRALSDNLHGLRNLGDQLARTEQDRLALTARVEELQVGIESEAQAAEAGAARLEARLEKREGVLERAREQLARQREKTADWKRKAAERWHELGALKARVKELERELAEARDANQPGALPRQAELDARHQQRVD